ncbi:MAG: cation transporter [Candidatus Micrarchaeota archaeon]|nr:cation transporter [Candidatus Micrarchaeota archaeon]
MAIKYHVFIKGMHCQSCEELIKDSIKDYFSDRIKVVEISAKKGLLVISTEEAELDKKLRNDLEKVIKNEGYEVVKISQA